MKTALKSFKKLIVPSTFFYITCGFLIGIISFQYKDPGLTLQTVMILLVSSMGGFDLNIRISGLKLHSLETRINKIDHVIREKFESLFGFNPPLRDLEQSEINKITAILLEMKQEATDRFQRAWTLKEKEQSDDPAVPLFNYVEAVYLASRFGFKSDNLDPKPEEDKYVV